MSEAYKLVDFTRNECLAANSLQSLTWVRNLADTVLDDENGLLRLIPRE
jgi:hypothetical protein